MPDHRNTPDNRANDRKHTQAGDQPSPESNAEMVCVTLQRPPHFWRFACAAGDSRELLETLANLADNDQSPLSWDDAELIASQIVLHHGGDRTQADPEHAR